MGLFDKLHGTPLGIDPKSVKHKIGVRQALARCDRVIDRGDVKALCGHWAIRYLLPVAVAGFLGLFVYQASSMFFGEQSPFHADSPFGVVFPLFFCLPLLGFLFAVIFVLPATETHIGNGRIEQKRFLVVIPMGTRRYEMSEIADVTCEPAKMPSKNHNGGIAHAVILKLRDGREIVLRYHEDKARVDAAVAVIREQLRLRPAEAARTER